MIKKLLPVLFLGVLVTLGSCKKCYNCSKTNIVNTNGEDVEQVLQFEACSQGKEGNGQDLKIAITNYEENGYTCTAK